MAKGKGKGKGKKKGRSRKSAPKRRGKLRGHKFGIAESLGAAKTAIDVAPDAWPAVKEVLKAPTLRGANRAASEVWDSLKDKGTPLITGVVISNMDKLPFVGKMLSGPKRTLDAVARKWLGMKV